MHETRNIALAWLSSLSCFAAAFQTRTDLSLLTTIVLPVTLYAAGKLCDFLFQLYLLRRFPDQQPIRSKTDTE